MNLTRFDGENGIELVIDTSTGESFSNIRGYARMSGKPVDTIAKRVTRESMGVDIFEVKQAELKNPGGLQGVRLKMDLPQARMILFHVCYGILKDEFPESLSSLMEWINSSPGAQLPFIADETKFLGRSKK